MTSQPPVPPNSPYQQYGPGYQPQGIPPVVPGKKGKKWPWIVGAVILILILAAALGGGDKDTANHSSASDNANTSASTADKSAAADADKPNRDDKPKEVGLDTAVRDGKFEFTVTDITKGLSSVGDNPYLTEKAQGQFVIVTMTVENIGDKPQSFSPSAQKLTDNKGRTFESDTTAQIALGGSDIPVWDSINPGNSVTVKLVFDMPKKATPTLIELHDSMFSGGAKVSLK